MDEYNWDSSGYETAGNVEEYNSYDSNNSYDAYGGYDPNSSYDPNCSYDAYGGYDPNSSYDPYGGYDPNSGYDPNYYQYNSVEGCNNWESLLQNRNCNEWNDSIRCLLKKAYCTGYKRGCCCASGCRCRRF